MPVKSFIVLVALLTIAVILFIQLASMPGVAARRRGHPHTKAINLLGWVGLPIGLVPWLIAMVWSQLDPISITRDIDRPESADGSAADEQTASQ